jgi:nucleotide-binding universal stress UspA family protein
MPPRKILVATDFSEPSRVAVRRASMLSIMHGAELLVVHVLDAGRVEAAAGPIAGPEVLVEERNAAHLLLEGLREELERAGARVEPLLLDGLPGEVIPGTAAARGVDLLVLGSRGHTGFQRLLLGSVAEKVLRASEVPSLIVRGPADAALSKLLVATDFSGAAERALAVALDLAAPGATVDVMHVVTIPTMVALPVRPFIAEELARTETLARQTGEELVERHRRPGLELRFTTVAGDAREAILRRLDEQGHDLVVLGTHGRTGLSRLVMGSVNEAVVRHAPCSVLVAR